MTIWKQTFTLADLSKKNGECAVTHLGIEFVDFGPDWLRARMPVDKRTKQPYGLLHGGASVLLAETLGSVGCALCIDESTHYCVGLEINANHVRGVRDGFVIGEARPLHLGRTTQIWEIRITEEGTGKLVCVSRITMAVLAK
jgi:1,4-dihydroxy-2-naphthoyl-CoA hydrolase